jgi:hypothetical protein
MSRTEQRSYRSLNVLMAMATKPRHGVAYSVAVRQLKISIR